MSFAWLGKKAREKDADKYFTSDSNRDDDNTVAEAQTAKSEDAPRGGNTRKPWRRQNAEQPKLSVHITNLPFSATKEDLNTFFDKHNCVVDDIRLVRKPNKHGEVLFTGVAFVDFFDAESLNKALTLHQRKLRDSDSITMNIRPTLDKSKLARVAARRDSSVQERKLQQERRRNKKFQHRGPGHPTAAAPHTQLTGKKRKKKKKLGKKERQRAKAKKLALQAEQEQTAKKPKLTPN